MLAVWPRRRLVSRDPLPWHPPSADLFWPVRPHEIEDHHDVPEIPVDLGRNVRIAAVEGETMHAGSAAYPHRYFGRCMRIADVIDRQASAQSRVCRDFRIYDLAINDHDPVRDLHLVR